MYNMDVHIYKQLKKFIIGTLSHLSLDKLTTYYVQLVEYTKC